MDKLKKPPNAFLLFIKDMKEKNIINYNKKGLTKEISKQLSNLWKQLDFNLKENYKNKANDLKIQFLKENPFYIEKRNRKDKNIDIIISNLNQITNFTNFNELIKKEN